LRQANILRQIVPAILSFKLGQGQPSGPYHQLFSRRNKLPSRWHTDCGAFADDAGWRLFDNLLLEIAMNEKRAEVKTNDPAANPDPITHAPGAHPVGSGVGAAAGGAVGAGAAIAAGAIAGGVVGPIGAAVGAVVGGVVGGLAGKEVAEGINPSIEHEYWRKHYTTRPYVSPGTSYDDVSPAYQVGWEARSRHSDKSFDQVEASLGNDWDRTRGQSKLKWDQARQAARDAWDHVDSNRQQG
jgi:hypothetical protein